MGARNTVTSSQAAASTPLHLEPRLKLNKVVSTTPSYAFTECAEKSFTFAECYLKDMNLQLKTDKVLVHEKNVRGT
jgi:hypothetical protein